MAVKLRLSGRDPIVIFVRSPFSIASPVAWLKKCLGTFHSNGWKSVELSDVLFSDRSAQSSGNLNGSYDFATVYSRIRGYSRTVNLFSMSSVIGVMSANLF